MAESRRTLYPPIEPHLRGHLDVDGGHSVYYEVSGNPQGKPVVVLHGGPGGGTTPSQRRYFDPERYRIVLFDQRGCGKSRPHASLDANTTWHLVDDIETLRRHLNVERWQLFGGSWGSTLALTYAINYPDRVTELVLRGIFLMRQWELDWFYQDGTSRFYPDAWAEFVSHIPEDERSDVRGAFLKRLTGNEREVQLAAARAWSRWEASTSFLIPRAAHVAGAGSAHFALAFARIEAHYFAHRGFFPSENYVLDNIGKISELPGVIVQGRYDVICPARSAWELSERWDRSKLVLVDDAGHSSFEAGIVHHLVEATDELAAG
ncbi:MAG: prolyl aminopeptidase [Deltaproteobacteria bacterium]|nr:prolyl aminopeptidase [Deltaproteobacteria bacterium]